MALPAISNNHKNTSSTSPIPSNMDHERALPTLIKHSSNKERLTLPPISSMDGLFASRSWPPPKHIASTLSSIGSSNAMSIQESLLSPPISRTDPWSPIPNKRQSKQGDYFSMGQNKDDENNNKYQPLSNQFGRRSSTNNEQDTFRYSSTSIGNSNNSLPTISYKNSSTMDYHSSSSTSSPSISHKNISIEPTLTPNSLSTPSIRGIEKDMDQVIEYSKMLGQDMSHQVSSILDNDRYFSNPEMKPWLDNMIGRANEVLNALLRLRKHQMAAEYARLHRASNIEGYKRNTNDISSSDSGGNLLQFQNQQDGEHWSTAIPNVNNKNGAMMSLNGGRLRKRGKRPVFQGRCHSCNTSETPEWRRGPDGARTLCNACGLHYAKLAKKKSKQVVEVSKRDLEDLDNDTSME